MSCPILSAQYIADTECPTTGEIKRECEEYTGEHLHCKCCFRTLNNPESIANHLCFFCRNRTNTTRKDRNGVLTPSHDARVRTARTAWA